MHIAQSRSTVCCLSVESDGQLFVLYVYMLHMCLLFSIGKGPLDLDCQLSDVGIRTFI